MRRDSIMSQIFLLIFFHFLPILIHGEPLAPALYVFGDSLLDSGNNNFLPTLAKANYPPYGIDFPKGTTGRFTNGRTVADFIAEFLGLPYAPAFLSLREPTTVTGLNFASGSCGILPETGRASGMCISLDAQVDLFERTVKSADLIQNPGNSSEKLSQHLSKSIFVVSVGSNDYLNIYNADSIFNSSAKNFTPDQIATFLSDKLAHNFQRLYNLRARKIVMFEVGPIGCIPSIAKTHKHSGLCLQESNQLVSLFNKNLPKMLQNLTNTLPGSIFVLARSHGISYDGILNPTKYGLKDTSNACCTTWENGTSGCIPFLQPCPNSKQYYFWDAYHLTESVYSTIASRCINDTSVCVPHTIQQLVKM